MSATKEHKAPSICQECKRLKIKCSRTVPCDQCVRRGVEEICPGGRLTTGRTGRYVLTSAETVHAENKQLKLRIRELEQALQDASQQRSHPLLEPRLLSIANTQATSEENPMTKVSNDDPLLNKFGTIQLDKGKDRWLGATALSEVHLSIHDKDDDFEPLVEEQSRFAVPFSMLYPPRIFFMMAHANLPPKEEAWSLLETFFEHAVYAYQLISREDFIKRILSPAYGGDLSTISSAHLGSLYSVLALGALHDLSRPIYAPETREWMEVGQSLMMTTFGDWETSMDSIESIALICCIFPARPELELSKTYYQTSWALKMAQSIGLHRDPKDLGLSGDVCLRRRRLFSELRLMDATESLLYGRPFTMNSRFVANGAMYSEDDLDEVRRFKCEILYIMEDVADLFMATGSDYTAILKTDRKLRALKPQNLSVNPSSTKDFLCSFMCSIWYYSTLLTLHRTHFAFAALKSSSTNRSGGKFAPSVMASYEAATHLVQAAIAFTREHPGLLSRLGLIWPHIFTSMVVLYSFGIHTPRWSKTQEALMIADECITSVYSPSIECVRAKETLPYLSMLRERAHATLMEKNTNLTSSSDKDTTAIPGLSTGLAIEALDAAKDNFHIKFAKEEQLMMGRGARALAFKHAALRHAHAHLFEQQPVPVPLAYPTSNPIPQQPVSNTDPTVLLGDGTDMDPNLLEIMNWTWSTDDSASHGSSPDQISQLELQSSWADFLLKL